MQQASFQLTKQDVIQAQKLHLKSEVRRPVPAILTFLLVPLISSVMSRAGFAGLWQTETAPLFWGAGVLVVIAVIFLVPPLLGHIIGTRQFRAVPALANPYTLTLTEDGPLVHHADGQHLHRWKNIQKIRSDQHSFLLYLAPWMFVVLPHTGFPPGMADQITHAWQQNRPAR